MKELTEILKKYEAKSNKEPMTITNALLYAQTLALAEIAKALSTIKTLKEEENY